MQAYELSPKFIVDNFISGLKDNIKPFVKAFNPQNIPQAISYARLQEDSLHTLQPKTHKPTTTQPYSVPFPSQFKPPLLPSPSDTKFPSKYPPIPTKNYRFIPHKVRAEKIAKGLCYYCDKPFERGHKCGFKEPQLFTVEIMDDDEASDGESPKGEIYEEAAHSMACISVQALTGTKAYQTMRVVGLVQKKPIHILIDTGSTHNFWILSMLRSWGV